uniref:Endo-beta-1,2-glucanase SGL domain-containing protein n=1 Tax=Plectus sambesii TaxID=2011161 RepID=A0A914W241_9BILA
MTNRIRSSSLLYLFITLLLTKAALAQDCNFAQSYSLDDLFKNPVAQDSFLLSASYWEGKFATDRVGLNYASALTYDGTPIDYDTGLPHKGLHEFSAASKESVHVSLLALALDGKSAFAVNFFQSGAESAGWSGSVQDYVIDQLTKKITSYENFNKQYPGFGGYIPWYAVNDTGMHLLWDWQNRVPSLDNGELIWGLIAAVQVLSEKNMTTL